jgi:hypothetical protein
MIDSATLARQLEPAEQLRTRRPAMLAPQDLPGRYGRVVRAVDHLLQAVGCEGVIGGGWAVWYHGYVGRVTQDVDIALPADRIAEVLRVASVSGFDVLQVPAGRRPKLRHQDTGLDVDILPEGGRPSTATRPAPTTIPYPHVLSAAGPTLRYMSLPALIELKLAAGRARDKSDLVELVRANPDQVASIREHLACVHADYVSAFDRLVQRAREQDES